jgi:hypothetical protein
MNEFRQWMVDAGFNGKQVTQAGAAIGISSVMANRLSQGIRELETLDRMAMAAHLAGLKPWTPADSEGLKARRNLVETVRQMNAVSGGS